MAKFSVCVVDGCDKGGKLRRGMCAPHYGRWKRLGDPLAGRPYAVRGEPMRYLLAHMHDDCPKWPFARGRGGYGHIQYEGVVRDIHRLVCEIEHGPPPTPDHDAAHCCGKGHEGCFGAHCLSWKTKAENQSDRIAHGTSVRGERQYASKLTEAQVLQIRSMEGVERARITAERFGVVPGTIHDIQRRRRWAWLNP